MSGSVYTFVGTRSAKNRTALIETSQGDVAIGQSGLFLASEFEEATGQELDLEPGPAVSPASQLHAPTVAVGSSGGLTGVYRYVVTFVTAAGETKPSAEANVTLSAHQASLSNIPVGSLTSGVTARNLYRTSAGGSAGTEKFVGTIADNTTTTAVDNLADGSLGSVVPTQDTAGVMSTGGSIAIQTLFAELTGNPTDDAFAIGAGTGEKISGGGGASVTVAGATGTNLGVTHTVDFDSAQKEIWLIGTLNANLTVTVSNRVAGCRAVLLLTQDGTGARTVTVSDGAGSSSAVVIDGTANALAVVVIFCPDAVNLDVTGDGSTLTRAAVIASGVTPADIGADVSGAAAAAQAAAVAASAQALTRTPVKTANYTAAARDSIPVDISAGSITVTLPAAPADGSRVAVKIVAVNATIGSTALTVTCGGSDVFNKAAGSTSLTFTALFQGTVLQYDHATAIWTAQATDTPLGSALGAAKLGTDGNIGGASGSPLLPSVVQDSATSPKGIDSTSVTDGQALIYNATAGKYKAATVQAGATVQGAIATNLGATQTIDFASVKQEIWLAGTLNANLAVTLANRVAGSHAEIIVLQDSTGARALTVAGQTVPINAAAGAMSVVSVRCPDSTAVEIVSPAAASLTDQQVLLRNLADAARDPWLMTGHIAQSLNRQLVSGNGPSLTSGTLFLVAVPVPGGRTLSNASFYTSNVGVTTPTNQWAALYDSSRNLLAVSNDQTTTAWSPNTLRTFAFTTTYTPSTGGLLYVGICIVAATAPNLGGLSAAPNVEGQAPILCGSSTASLTNPASAPATAGALLSKTPFWASLS